MAKNIKNESFLLNTSSFHNHLILQSSSLKRKIYNFKISLKKNLKLLDMPN